MLSRWSPSESWPRWHEPVKQRINTAPGPIFSVKKRYRNALRISGGIPWTKTIESPIRTLGDLLAWMNHTQRVSTGGMW